MRAIFNYFFSKVTGILLPSLFLIIFQYNDLQAQCPANSDRIYATSDNWTSLGGFLTNGVYSFDANPSTAANITTVVGLAGLGGGYYDLFFDQTFPSGTPVSIKMGKQYSGLGLISGFLVYGLNTSGNPIGPGDSVDAGIINLLSADSAFEFTFVPHNSSGNQPYSGVRIYFGSLLSVADTYKVYEAYVKQSSTSLDCSTFQFDSYDDDGDGIDDLNDGIQATDPYVRKDVQDLFYGVEVLAGLDALSATASVVHPFYAADNDLDTYAILNRGVAVLNNALVRVDFKSESLIGDEIEILLSRSDNGLLQLGLINGIQISLYHEGSLVMGPITNTDLILNLELLNLVSSNHEVASITLTPPMVFDQVTVSYGGVANVLDAIRIHEINKKSVIETVVVPNVSGQVELCATDMLSIQMQDNCTHYEIFDSTNNPLTTSNNYDFELPDGLTEGDYTFYIQAIRQGCELGIPHEITIHINPNALDTDIDNVLINGMPETDLCLVSNPSIILSTQLSTTSTITNPTFIWYDSNGNVISGGENGTLDLGSLSIGTYTYGVSVKGDSVCPNLNPNQITFTINDEPTPTTTDATQEFCAANNPTAADMQVNESSVVWYDAPTGGNVVDPTTVLTDGTSYYAAYQGTTCESSTRLQVDVTVNDEPTPTTTDATQEFCAANNPTAADIQVNESSVVWYDAPTGGNIVDPTTALTDGTSYYAAYQGTTCESSTRLQVDVTVNDEPTPTTTDTTQEFCAANNPTAADIQVNESSVVWYDAPTGGNIVDPTTVLTDGTSYYAAYQGTTCESSTRLQVDVTVLELGIATLDGPTQNVCYGASDYNCMYTTDSNMSNYQWTINGGTIISGGGINDDFVEVNWIIHPIGNVTVTYNDSALCGGIASKSFDINIVPCSDLTITKTADHEEVAAGDTVIFTITVSNGGTSNVTNVEVLENLPSGYTYVSHTTSTGIYDISNGIWNIPNLYANSSETLLVTVLVNPTGDYVNTAAIINDPVDMDPDNNIVLAEVSVVCLTVYNEFSPNNDGENDFFIIDCIENYPNNKIEIFNRYGNVVYETSSYDNTWNGIANVSGVVKKGEYLPNGTYFYVLKIDELNYSKTGWLYLAR